ncbi:hypothetical protein [Spartinivicinus poritis]|uniref:Lipoprotein n=1 Tax=Spartinivicinus poritis TaxID=2994640 RepID=A0ABT5UH22_9GAMM|nr:hypothetical protein [Spartinivicinus sp. A2-2]MDE1464354.1 hypothetical protein [Spartinivicinus sp. A2-2]
MKHLLPIFSIALLTACGSNQTTTDTHSETTEPVSTQVEPVEPTPVDTEADKLRRLWERYCNHEALTIEERQMIADSEMPEDLRGQCTQK